MEEDENDWNFETEFLTLKELSAKVFASHLWDLPDMKQEMENFLDQYYPFWRKRTQPYNEDLNRVNLVILSKQILKIIQPKLSHLYELLKMKIQDEVLEMGEKIFNWIMYLTQDLDLDAGFAKKIYWTSSGRINEDMIFKAYWMNSPDGKRGERFHKKLILSDYLACFFALEDFIINFQIEIVSRIDSISRNVHVYGTVYFIMKFIIGHYDKYLTLSSIKNANPNLIPTSNSQILDICVSLGFYKAFVFFWNPSDASERNQYLQNKSLSNLGAWVEANYISESLFRIRLFLLDKMNATQKYNFISRNVEDLFLAFLERKPFQKFCIPLLDDFLSFLSNIKIKVLAKSLVRQLEKSNDRDKCFVLQILKFMMDNVSAVDKKKSIAYGVLPKSESCSLFKMFYIPALKLILQDKDLQDIKRSLISTGNKKFKDLIRQNQFELLDEFMDEVFVTESEKLKFKVSQNFEGLITSGEFDVADNLLRWIHGDEAHSFKILSKPLILNIIPKHKRIDDLLKWYFEIPEQPLIKNCDHDKSVFLKEFCRESIFHVWFIHGSNREPESKMTVSLLILTAFFGSEEEITDFKRNELAKDESCLRFWFDATIPGRELNMEIVDNFFNFCSLGTEEIDVIKKSIAVDISDWIRKYGVTARHLDIVVPLLDWVYGSLNNNRSRLKYYFSNDQLFRYYRRRKIKVLS